MSIRFRLGERLRPTELVVGLEEGWQIVLRASSPGASIAGTDQLAPIVQPCATEPKALEAGTRWRGMVAKAFAPLSVGAGFGDHAATEAVTEYGLSVVAARLGRRVLNDVRVLAAALSQ